MPSDWRDDCSPVLSQVWEFGFTIILTRRVSFDVAQSVEQAPLAPKPIAPNTVNYAKIWAIGLGERVRERGPNRARFSPSP